MKPNIQVIGDHFEGRRSRFNRDLAEQVNRETDYCIKKGIILPNIELKPISLHAVHVGTQKEHDHVLEIYEAGGWTWLNSNKKPTAPGFMFNSSSVSCLCCGIDQYFGKEKTFGIGDIETYEMDGFTIIKPESFYQIQRISQGTRNKIWNYFDEKRSIESRGKKEGFK